MTTILWILMSTAIAAQVMVLVVHHETIRLEKKKLNQQLWMNGRQRWGKHRDQAVPPSKAGYMVQQFNKALSALQGTGIAPPIYGTSGPPGQAKHVPPGSI